MTTQPTDQELKLGLAKLLTDKIIHKNEAAQICKSPFDGDEIYLPESHYYFWSRTPQGSINARVRETEWLHVCWLIEQSLTDNVLLVYEHLLKQIVLSDSHNTNRSEYTASWQQRATAILQTKGML